MIPSQTKEFIGELRRTGLIPSDILKNAAMELAEKHFEGYIAIGWTREDIQDRAEEVHEVQLSDEQADSILESLARNFDACQGINWDVIDTHIEMSLAE